MEGVPWWRTQRHGALLGKREEMSQLVRQVHEVDYWREGASGDVDEDPEARGGWPRVNQSLSST